MGHIGVTRTYGRTRVGLTSLSIRVITLGGDVSSIYGMVLGITVYGITSSWVGTTRIYASRTTSGVKG